MSLKPEEKNQVKELVGALSPLVSQSDFSVADVEKRVREEAEKRGMKLAPLAKAMRFAVTGGKISPGLFEMLEVQGKDRVLRRMRQAVEALS
jgi:glutamyl/glutaminyl-tRNA synthetase